METSQKKLSVRLKLFFLWIFYASKDAFDPDMGPDVANILVLFCSAGCASLIAIPVAIFIAFIAVPEWWYIAAIPGTILYLFFGLMLRSVMADFGWELSV